MDGTTYPASNCVFRLAKAGLVLVESQGPPEAFYIFRPASLQGREFIGSGRALQGAGAVALMTNAPPVLLRQCSIAGAEWEVDISLVAAPGPGPVWLRQKFPSVSLAVDVIHQMLLGDGGPISPQPREKKGSEIVFENDSRPKGSAMG